MTSQLDNDVDQVVQLRCFRAAQAVANTPTRSSYLHAHRPCTCLVAAAAAAAAPPPPLLLLLITMQHSMHIATLMYC
jgi:hypothetical protein